VNLLKELKNWKILKVKITLPIFWPVDTTSENSLKASLQGLKAREDWEKIFYGRLRYA